MGERLFCTQEVIGSIPFTSTKLSDLLESPIEIKGFSRRIEATRPL